MHCACSGLSIAVLLVGCTLSGSPEAEARPMRPTVGCLAQLDGAMPRIESFAEDPTDEQAAVVAQQECQQVLGDIAACDVSDLMPREAFLCAALRDGVEEGINGWRVHIFFLERLGRICWTVQTTFEDSTRKAYQFDATTGELLSTTNSSSIP